MLEIKSHTARVLRAIPLNTRLINSRPNNEPPRMHRGSPQVFFKYVTELQFTDFCERKSPNILRSVSVKIQLHYMELY